MNTEQLKEAIESGDRSAYGLLFDKMPRASEKFKSLSDGLAELLEEVKIHFPDAKYYTPGGNGFDLVLGDIHGRDGEGLNNELIALSSIKFHEQGGDW